MLALLSGELGLAARATRRSSTRRSRAPAARPAGVSSKLDVALAPGERADAAAVAICARLLGRSIEVNLPGTLADVDSEFLHDLRVAVRRTRALQRELRGVFPPEPLRALPRRVPRLQEITGPTRDLDVYLLEFDELARRCPRQRRRPRAAARAARARRAQSAARWCARCARARTRALLRTGARCSTGSSTAPEATGPTRARPIADVAGERIAKVYRQMVKEGARDRRRQPAEALHDLRKKGKELRYLLEFFARCIPAEVVKPMVGDAQGAAGHARPLPGPRGAGRAAARARRRDRRGRGRRRGADGDGRARRAARRASRRGARAEFAERFAAFAAKPQRKLVEETFG